MTEDADSDGAVHDQVPVDEGGGAVKVRIGEAIVAKYDESGDKTPVTIDKSGVMASSVEYKTTNYMEMVVALRETVKMMSKLATQEQNKKEGREADANDENEEKLKKMEKEVTFLRKKIEQVSNDTFQCKECG